MAINLDSPRCHQEILLPVVIEFNILAPYPHYGSLLLIYSTSQYLFASPRPDSIIILLVTIDSLPLVTKIFYLSHLLIEIVFFCLFASLTPLHSFKFQSFYTPPCRNNLLLISPPHSDIIIIISLPQ